jgi:cell division septation protein DedD
VGSAPEPKADAADANVSEAPAPKPVKGKTTAKAAKTAKATKTGKFTVQVAAYYDKAQAHALATKLRGRGYPVHVDGETAPFRVRIGYYETHAQAATALANLKAKKITGFVTQE